MSSKHLVVLRFSAMGDVALTVPVLQYFTEQYPNDHLTIVTRSRFAGLFKNLSQTKICSIDFNKEYSGIFGLWKLIQVVRSLKPDVVLDLHDNLRTKIVRQFLKLTGTKVAVFSKGRAEKKLATGQLRANHRKPLIHTSARYAKAFGLAGFPLEFNPANRPAKFSRTSLNQENEIRIGIAPFAAHATKRWPIQNFEVVIGELTQNPKIKIYLFGGGTEEVAILKNWSARFQHCINVAGNYSLDEELELIKSLRLMICTDSSNMHLASISGIPVVSIWGGTHTVTGFGPLPMEDNAIVEIPTDELPCRPCSVFGKAHCERGDFACLTRIHPDRVISEVRKRIQ